MSGRTDVQNYYEILEVSAGAPHHEIVRAYEQAKINYAPDSPALYTMFTADEAQELRLLVEEAFRTLGNHSKRKEYDAKLLGRSQTTNSEYLPDFGPIPEPTPLSSRGGHLRSHAVHAT